MAVADAPTIAFRDQPAFRTWLAEHHREQDGIWLKLAKKGSGIPSVTYAEAVVVALCFGWIDGQARSVDETSYVQRFTPRRSRSKWSKINIGKVQRLIASGEMTPSGLAEVERAKTDGRWAAAYDPPSTATVPDDLRVALDANPSASASFSTITSASRYAILFQIGDAKRPDTRARRIAKFVDDLASGREPYPRAPSKKPERSTSVGPAAGR